MDRMIKGKCTPRTDILSSLNLAEKVFKGDSRRPVLVLLSDMYKDSAEFNFTQIKPTEEFANRMIEQHRKLGLLPVLNGARVYVAGASADSSRRAYSLEQFWRSYFSAAKGQLAPEHYGPSLISFDE